MPELLVVALAGFLASMVDGALGMGFGPTSASILLSAGLSPAATSATVNLAKIATGLAGGLSHWRFRNVEWRLVRKLAIPGAIGALVGTTVLARVDGDDIRPFLAVLLALVGLRILFRFSRPLPAPVEDDPTAVPAIDERGMTLTAAAGGVTNGLVGAWGPVVTPYLLHRGLPARYAVGCVNTAEVAVAVVAFGSLLGSLGGSGIELGMLVAMLVGGVLAAPLAAYVVRFFPPRVLGLAVACLLLLTQTRELANAFDLDGGRWFVYLGVVGLALVAAMRPRLTRDRAALPATTSA